MASERFIRFDPGPIVDDWTVDEHNGMEVDHLPDILRIAIDFGTTFSSVAYARTPADRQITTPMDIACISRYPDEDSLRPHQEPRQDVPTEVWYPRTFHTDSKYDNSFGIIQDQVDSDNESIADSDASSALSVELLEKKQTPNTVSKPPDSDQRRHPDALAWGFEVQKRLATEDIPHDGDGPVTKFKLLLAEPNDKSENIQKLRMDTAARLKKLKKLRMIKCETDVITHFLEKLFVHIKKELQQQGRLESEPKLEFVLCVPAEWPSKACRVMQDSMAKAAEFSGLGVLKDGSLDNLFIVSEPEAAAACIMAESEHDIFAGETVVILDAGGGTVDAVTYEVTNSNPLRMSAEVVGSRTELCGASYINEHYAAFLLNKLKNETYLETNGKTIRSIVDRKVVEFENSTKRVWDLNDRYCSIRPIWIDNLLPSRRDRQLQRNRLDISAKDVEKIYRYSLKGTTKLLKEQLEWAKAKGHVVSKVLLTGGFGQSPFLQSHLKGFLKDETNFRGREIILLVPNAASTAVARGAILRASNKELGPRRLSQCSYGFLRSEPYEPEVCPAHRGTKPRVDPVDGEKYVHDTIHWLFHKGQELEVGKKESIIVRHTFAATRKHLICKEVLYVSDDFRESHYRNTHAMNKGAEIAGSICVDMTFLKDEGHILPELVSDASAHIGKNKKILVVEFELVVRVDGRNLVYEARWPKECKGDDVIRAQGQTCIAATFKPGTA